MPRRQLSNPAFQTDRAQIGRWAEDKALDFLLAQGLRLQARNVGYRCGEIDLIMTHADQLVFVEVRYRARPDYGGAAGSVDLRKRQRISRAARLWLQRYDGMPPPCRFDLVVFAADDMRWIPAAFLADGLL